MSTTTNKASTKGIRYTDAQKQEVTDFANNYNAENGRGGQSKAAEKFNISQLTIAGWLKGGSSSSSKGPKAAKAPKAAKSAKSPKTAGKSKVGSRYTDEQKKEVTDFVASYNAENRRGGASQASKKYSVSPLTVVAWLKAAGVNGSKKAATKSAGKGSSRGSAKSTKGAVITGSISSKLNSLLELSNQIAEAEDELAQMKAKFDSLKASL